MNYISRISWFTDELR